jgi:Cdc6-like AAA superfamily ATPase
MLERPKVDDRAVKTTVNEISSRTKDVASLQKLDAMHKWLSPPDPSTNFNKALQQRQEGTGLWLLQSSPFTKWHSQQNSFLWLHGIPGCGKTILSSTIIEHLVDTYPDQVLLYFYFDFTDAGKQTLDNVIRSLISQLYHKRKATQKLLDSLFSTCDDGRRQPTCELLCKVFLQMINQAQEIYIVLDALDECRTRKGPLSEGLLAWTQSLLELGQGNVHLLVTSRPEHDIELVLRNLAEREEDIVPLQSNVVDDDIRSYVHTRVRQGNGLKRWQSQPDVLDEIETQLMKKAKGM